MALSAEGAIAGRVLLRLVAFAPTWGAQLPRALAALEGGPGPVKRYLPLMGLGALGPALAAWLCVRADGCSPTSARASTT